MSLDIIKSSKFPLLKKNNYKLGFEVEFLFKPEEAAPTQKPGQLSDDFWCEQDAYFVDLYKKVNAMMKLIHPGMDVCSDCSVKPVHAEEAGTWSMEARTPALPPQESLEVLHNTFEFVGKHGFTNRTCGLHTNFSPDDDTVYASLNPLPIVMSPLWDKIKADFGRSIHTYCAKSKIRDMGLLAFWQKVTSRVIEDYWDGHAIEVNFLNYRPERDRRSRIEMRCMGGEKYHTRFDEIVNYVHQTVKVFRRGYAVKF